jgi:type II secretory pathway component PulF
MTTHATSTIVDAHVRRLMAAGAAVPEGLEAAADECRSRSMAKSLRALAGQLRRGASWGTGIKHSEQFSAEGERIAALAGSESHTISRLSLTIADMERLENLRRELRWVAFPFLIASACGSLVAIVGMLSAYQIREAAKEFSVSNLESLLAASMVLVSIIGIAVMLVVLAWVVWICRYGLGCHGWDRMAWRIPILGPSDRSLEGATVSRSLSRLIENRIPFAECLRLSRSTITSKAIQKWLDAAIINEQRGAGLTQAIRSFPIPGVLPSLFAGPGALPELHQAWGLTADQLEENTRRRIALARKIFPIFAYLVIGTFLLWSVTLPLMWLMVIIQLFSSFGMGVTGTAQFTVPVLQVAAGAVFSSIAAVIFGVAWTIRSSWYQRTNQMVSRWWLDQWVFVGAVALSVAVPLFILPPLVGYPLAVTGGAATCMLMFHQRRVDRQTTYRALGLALNSNLSLEQVADQLGNNRNDYLGSQLRELSRELSHGKELGEACHRVGLSEADWLVQSDRQQPYFAQPAILTSLTQLAYQKSALTAIGLLMLAGNVFVVPTIEKMLGELEIPLEQFGEGVHRIRWIMLVGGILPLFFMPLLLLGCLPRLWPFLPGLRQWWQYGRAQIMRMTAAMMREGRRLQPAYWKPPLGFRQCVLGMQWFMDQGLPIEDVLVKAGVVIARDAPWLQASQASLRTPEVLSYLAESSERNSLHWLHRFISFFWLMNLFLVGVLVYCAGSLVFASLCDLARVNAQL